MKLRVGLIKKLFSENSFLISGSDGPVITLVRAPRDQSLFAYFPAVSQAYIAKSFKAPPYLLLSVEAIAVSAREICLRCMDFYEPTWSVWHDGSISNSQLPQSLTIFVCILILALFYIPVLLLIVLYTRPCTNDCKASVFFLGDCKASVNHLQQKYLNRIHEYDHSGDSGEGTRVQVTEYCP